VDRRGAVLAGLPDRRLGIGLAANAWDAYGRRPISEERIEREVRKLER
jgi:hypothetical protein